MRNAGSLVFGLLLITFGTVFLLDNLGYVDFEYVFENFWPLILVLIGVSLILRRRRVIGADSSHIAGITSASPETSGDFLIRSAIFGDIDAKVNSKNFSGGSCSVIFGNINADLLETMLKQGQSTLKLNSVFGGIRLEIPAGIEVAVNATSVAGEIQVGDQRKSGLFETLVFKSPGFESADRKLIIQASQMFGDVRVRIGS